MALTIDTRTYNFDVQLTTDSCRYTGPDHTSSFIDTVILGRTSAKPTSDYAGKNRGRAKLTRTMVDSNGDNVGEAIFETNCSVPVGSVQADVDAFIVDGADMVSTSLFTNVVNNHDINQ